MADVWVNSIACYLRTTCHIAKCCHLANSMSWSQSYVSHCRVLLTGEFNDMSSQSHVSRCRVGFYYSTWWIHCHDPRATYHIAGCKNSIRHTENRCAPYLTFCFLNAVWALTSGSFRIVSDTHSWGNAESASLKIFFIWFKYSILAAVVTD